MFQQAPVAVAVLRGRVATELVFELVNPRYMEILPPGREPLGARLRDVLPELSDDMLGVMQRVLDTGEPFVANDYRVPLDRDNDGVPEDYYFNFVYHPLVEPDAAVSGIVAVGTEVTESVQARRDAERLRAEAEAANVAKSEFLAVMSHELRTPLNAIGGYAELIELGIRGPVTAEQAADLARIQRSQRHLLGLIDGVLDFARVEGGHVQYEIADVSVDDVLTTCETLVAPQARAKQLILHYPNVSETLFARADPEKLQQIVLPAVERRQVQRVRRRDHADERGWPVIRHRSSEGRRPRNSGRSARAHLSSVRPGRRDAHADHRRYGARSRDQP